MFLRSFKIQVASVVSCTFSGVSQLVTRSTRPNSTDQNSLGLQLQLGLGLGLGPDLG